MIAGGGLVVLVIAFSNSSGPSAPKPKLGNSGSNTSVAPASPTAIQQYSRQLEEDTRGLAQERAKAEQMRADALRLTAGQQKPYQNPYTAPPRAEYGGAAGTPGQRQLSPEETARAERRKREEDSLKASNVALSFRKDQPRPPNAAPASAPATELAELRELIDAQKSALQATIAPVANLSPVQQSPSAIPAETANVPQQEREQTKTVQPGKSPGASLQEAHGTSFRVFEGTIIETVLANRLNGSFSGPVNALVTTAVYSHDGEHVLIPQGSRVLGEVQRVSTTGQQRLAVVFHRLIMPDGYSVNLDQFKGLNQIGETGLKDQANQHYIQIFGTSLALGAIAGMEQAGGNYGYNMNGIDAYREGVAQSLSGSATRILDRFLNVLPTITIREGHRIKVYLTDDIMLPAYENHVRRADM